MLDVCLKLLGICKVCQSRPEFWVFDIARLQLEPKICIDREEQTVKPPAMDGQRGLSMRKWEWDIHTLYPRMHPPILWAGYVQGVDTRDTRLREPRHQGCRLLQRCGQLHLV